ncbi:flagellin domain protein [Gluconacetobacter diazotrophicus PA1 5]|uniref:flagellin n=1 Tax=Gluconacetobacter diazotrophicus TaxID=33996 RepID=UPI000173C8D0|nr:flagellin [Gluconacetobacter diazotrophicus]ACI53164.1 flagellin domain protein [Gluconacetobacter diazotrophicus PA1 5]TWB10463.1 flagellin [Gluconacetobacter diazotrophicus]
MSLSINTNTSEMIALQTLDATQTSLSKTENAVSTGKSVATAADGPAAFGIAQQMSGNIAGQTAVNSGLSFAAQVVSGTSDAANQIITLLQGLQGAITNLGNDSGSPTSLGQDATEITGYLAQIDTIARNATFNGVNLLAGASTDGRGITSQTLNYVTGLQGDTQSVSGFNSTIAAAIGSGVAGVTVSGSATASMSEALGLAMGGSAGANATANVFVTYSGGTGSLSTAFGSTVSDQVAAMIKQVQVAITAMTNVTSTLGNASNLIASMTTYGTTVSDDLTAGVGALTDANMAAESAQLTSLQTKQSLAIKSLTIANGQSQNILQLFQ